jgi:UTP--glucose-1-phosphate uridylyltransferase
MEDGKQTIRKVVLPAAGLGTRLLSATKEQPKEMLSVFAATEDGNLCLKPIVQRIFEQLYDFGIREFCFIVGREKRAIEDHFTPERYLIDLLNAHRKNSQAGHLEDFYKKIQKSTIVWLNQPEPRGFGDAVLQAERIVGQEPFLVHAGDTLIITDKAPTLPERLTEAHTMGNADATLAVQDVHDPRQYGVAEVNHGTIGNLIVKRVVEKPSDPASTLAIMPLYVFNPTIFTALKDTLPGKGGELQLTDAIQRLIDTDHKVQAIKLCADDVRLDIGTPETYWEALELSHRNALDRQVTRNR